MVAGITRCIIFAIFLALIIFVIPNCKGKDNNELIQEKLLGGDCVEVSKRLFRCTNILTMPEYEFCYIKVNAYTILTFTCKEK